MEIKKQETLDTVRELQAAYKMICFPKDCSKSGHSEEAPSRTSFKEPHIFNVKKKYKGSIDLIVKGKFLVEQRHLASQQAKLFAYGVLVMEFPCSNKILHFKC